MSLAKLSLTCAVVGVSLSGCGIAAKPLAGAPDLSKAPGVHGRVDRLRHEHYLCIVHAGLPARIYTAAGGRPAIQVGTAPSGPTVVFEPTPGAAQEDQIDGQVESAEVIGTALLYPNDASDKVLSKVEGCVAIDVTG